MDMSVRPSGTTAASTAFCAVKVEGPSDDFVWFDGNGKITAANGTLDKPKPNAFSLLQIVDCPFATPSCSGACYVHNLEQFAPETHALYRHNSSTIRKIFDSGQKAVDDWEAVLADYIDKNCSGGFRWHVSGDIWSAAYATFIANVCAASPHVHHWIYTRSFPYVPFLMRVSTTGGGNLAINLSCDSDNFERGSATAAYYGLRRCYMTLDGVVPAEIHGADVIFPDYTLRGGTPEGMHWFEGLPPEQKKTVCPVDFHGKSEHRRCGPCARCLT